MQSGTDLILFRRSSTDNSRCDSSSDMTATSSSDLKRMQMGDKEEEEEEEQTSRGSPVIGKCWFWHLNSQLQLSLLDKKSIVDVVFQGHLLVTVIVASVMEVLGLRCDQDNNVNILTNSTCLLWEGKIRVDQKCPNYVHTTIIVSSCMSRPHLTHQESHVNVNRIYVTHYQHFFLLIYTRMMTIMINILPF